MKNNASPPCNPVQGRSLQGKATAMATTPSGRHDRPADLKPSSKTNPCPICVRTKDGDCRIGERLVLCHHGTNHHPPAGLRPGYIVTGSDGQQWAYTGKTEDQRAAVFKVQEQQNQSWIQPTVAALLPARTAPADINLARLHKSAKEPPAHWPDGTTLPYSATQQVVVRTASKAKRHLPEHRSGNGFWVMGKGPDPWPLWQEEEALHHGSGQWIAEAEGEKCAEWLRAGGLVAVSQPGHNHTREANEARYGRLHRAGIAGVAYLADNDEPGQHKASKCAAAAAAAGLAFVAIHAAEVWPGLPEAGSVDDAPGTAAERALDFERAVRAANPAAVAASLPPTGKAGTQGRRRIVRADEALALMEEQLGRLELNLRTGNIHRNGSPEPFDLKLEDLYLRLSTPALQWTQADAANAAMALARLNAFDPAKRYLNSLEVEPLQAEQWDRLDLHLLGSEDQLAARALQRFLVSAVARVYEPGCYVRLVPVLVGPQERGKSTLGKILFGERLWVEGVGAMDKDALLKCHTAWGVELAELDGVTRRADLEHMKAFLTETQDVFRAPYERRPERCPRRFVFWGTANRAPLRDATGNTRFLVIEIPDRLLPLDWATANRDALWARAVQQYRSGFQWAVTSEEERLLFAERNANYTETDAWQEEIEKLLAEAKQSGAVPVTRDQVFDRLGVEMHRRNNDTGRRVRQVIEALGWRQRRGRVPALGGQAIRGFWPPDIPPDWDGWHGCHAGWYAPNPLASLGSSTPVPPVPPEKGKNIAGEEVGTVNTRAVCMEVLESSGGTPPNPLEAPCPAVDFSVSSGGTGRVVQPHEGPNSLLAGSLERASRAAPAPPTEPATPAAEPPWLPDLNQLRRAYPSAHVATLVLKLDPRGDLNLSGAKVKPWLNYLRSQDAA